MTEAEARSAAPDPALVARFKAALDRLWPEGGKLGLAVSGGPDSMAMLLLAEAAIPGQFEAATVDHSLRPEAADECALVARVCAERGIPCEVLRVAVAAGNLQAEARKARYDALARWAQKRRLSALATAHHSDDQAETLLMRLNRGSGVSGLAGVRARGALAGTAVRVVRPVLDFRRSQLAQCVSNAGIRAVKDPSNEDQRFDRARMRSALAAADWLEPGAIAYSASHLADADEALDWAAEHEWNAAVTVSDYQWRYRPAAPRAVVLRVLERIINASGRAPRGQDVARLLERLENGQGGNVAGILATVRDGDWIFAPEPPRRDGQD